MFSALIILLYSGAVINVPSDVGTIQCALNMVENGDVIQVAPGIYFGNFVFPNDKSFILSSSAPDVPEVVLSTILDGRLSGTVVVIPSINQTNPELQGITVQNGRAELEAGGVSSGNSPGTVSNCVVRNNTCVSADVNGIAGGISNIDGRVDNNVIMDNISLGIDSCDEDGCSRIPGIGGGIHGCSGEVTRNVFVRNSGERDSGLAIRSSHGLIANNLIRDHALTPVMDCDGIVRNNEISHSGSAGIKDSRGTIARNYIHDNASDAIDSGNGNGGVRAGNVIENYIANNNGGGIISCSLAEGNIFRGNTGGSVVIAHIARNNLAAFTG